jgi:hypothetical protein
MLCIHSPFRSVKRQAQPEGREPSELLTNGVNAPVDQAMRHAEAGAA